ncbi:hypothetical protein ABVK25_008148 [Lepraria finkii]|uniref:Uncharacterized protein n=1 Tax=Lepraria finkii TaxID=1340010 RepID=A0ABR4B3A1_9LECA
MAQRLVLSGLILYKFGEFPSSLYASFRTLLCNHVRLATYIPPPPASRPHIWACAQAIRKLPPTKLILNAGPRIRTVRIPSNGTTRSLVINGGSFIGP